MANRKGKNNILSLTSKINKTKFTSSKIDTIKLYSETLFERAAASIFLKFNPWKINDNFYKFNSFSPERILRFQT